MSSRLLIIATQIIVTSIIIAVVLLFIGIGVLVLLHICIVGRAFRRGLSTISRGERCNNEAGNGLSPDDLQKLPCYDYNAGDKGNSSSPVDCAVCLESFQTGDKCRLLPTCRHSFHAHCVDSWLLMTPICPICRTRACQQKGGDQVVEDGVGFELRESRAIMIGFPAIAGDFKNCITNSNLEEMNILYNKFYGRRIIAILNSGDSTLCGADDER